MERELLAALAVMLGAFAQAATGIGFALVCAPLLVLCVGAHDGVLLVNCLGLLLSTMVLSREWRHTNLKHSIALFIPALIVAPLAGYVARHASPAELSITAGVLILAAVALLASGLKSRHLQGKSGVVFAGGLSGAMSLLAGVGGPAVALYAINANWEAKTLRPTLNVYFIALSIVVLTIRGTPSASATFVTYLAIAVVVGFIVGSRLSRRLSADHVRTFILIVAGTGGTAALIKGLAFA